MILILGISQLSYHKNLTLTAACLYYKVTATVMTSKHNFIIFHMMMQFSVGYREGEDVTLRHSTPKAQRKAYI